MRMFKRLSIIALAVLAFTVSVLAFVPLTPNSLQVTVPQGASLRTVAKIVAKDSVAPWWLLEASGRLTGAANAIKVGRYTVPEAHSVLGFWRALAAQTPEMVEIKLQEGWTFKQIRQAIDENDGLKHDTEGLDNAALMGVLGVPTLAPEGRFFPDTYMLVAGSSDVTVYRTAFERMKKIAGKVWQDRPADSPLKSVDDLINLAAIVEKETGLAADRPKVASVFHNRLKIGMRLQTDPTVIYGMGDAYKGKIRKADLLEDNPFNTYTRTGLPPTPIAAASEASLKAAIKPAETDYLFFVARGDGAGGSRFSATLSQHNRAVADYLARR
jgi:UPF0755 protein